MIKQQVINAPSLTTVTFYRNPLNNAKLAHHRSKFSDVADRWFAFDAAGEFRGSAEVLTNYRNLIKIPQNEF